MLAKIVFKLANYFLSDESIIALLVYRGYNDINIKTWDGTSGYRVAPVGKPVKL